MMATESFCHFDCCSSNDFIQKFSWFYTCILALEQRQIIPRYKILLIRRNFCHSDHGLLILEELLSSVIICTIFHESFHVYSPRGKTDSFLEKLSIKLVSNSLCHSKYLLLTCEGWLFHLLYYRFFFS